MSIGHSPWPGGLIATKRDQSFDSLESQLHNMLQHIGETSTEYINNFLQGAFDKENVVIERRSFMRYLRSDERFTFHGTTRSRTIMAAKEKVIDGWGKVAETIVEMMLAGTLEKDDVDFTISHEKLRAEVSEKLRAEVSIENYDQGDILFDKAIEILGYERRISGELDDKKELSYSWGQGCFLGFSPSAKKPSGVSLPPRTWEVAKQLMDKVNQVKKDEITDRLRNIKGSITVGQLIDDIENDDIVTYGTGNPILEVALNRPGNINTSEIFELAIEVLKANLWPRQEG